MKSSLDILVIGSGIFGITAAVELQSRGHSVIVADASYFPNSEASSHDYSKVVRMDYGKDEFYMSLMEKSLKGWQEWNKMWNEDVYHETGLFLLTKEKFTRGTYECDSYIRLKDRGYSVERLDSRSIPIKFPAFNNGKYIDGYYNPNAGWAQADKVLEILVEEAKKHKINYINGFKFTDFIQENSRIVGARNSEGEVIKADLVIIACGAWSPYLVPELEDKIWATGQPVFYCDIKNSSEYQLPEYSSIWAADITKTGWYGFPLLSNGILKIANHGQGRKINPNNIKKVNEKEILKFKKFIKEEMPSIPDVQIINTKLCLYCETWDGNFYIDYIPGREGLFIASGGSGHGFKFAPILGALIADIVEKKSNRYAYKFAWRDRGEVRSEISRN